MARRLEATPGVLVAVLVVCSGDDDQATLQAILASWNWTVAVVPSIKRALSWMARRGYPSLVICSRDLPDGNWKLLFQQTQALSRPPKFIVSSRLADDYLWVEVLNLGAENVLAVPFDTREVAHVVACARDAWNEQWLCAGASQPYAAVGSPAARCSKSSPRRRVALGAH